VLILLPFKADVKGLTARGSVLISLRGLISLHSRKILLGAIILIFTVLVVPPIGMLVISSFRATQDKLPFEATSYTIDNYVNAFASPVTYGLLFNTAWFAGGAVAVAMALAVIFAWFLERTDFPFRRLFFVLTLAPMGMPVIITTMAWILLANPSNGLFNLVLRSLLGLHGRGPINIYTIPGMILITALSFVPVIYIMISGIFARIDPSFEEAARTSGAGAWVTFRRISMPLLNPAVFAAAIFYLVRCIELFETPAMLGMPRGIFLFSTAIYYAVSPHSGFPNYGLASAYGMVLLVAAAVLVYFYGRYVRRAERFATVTGRGYRPQLMKLGRWKFVPVVAMSIYFVLTVAMPLLILVWSSLAPAFAKISVSSVSLLNLDAYRRMLDYPEIRLSVKNTLVIATATALISMLLVTVGAWLSVRGGMRGSWLPDRLAFMVVGVPGVVLGLALIFIYTSLPIPLYGSIWIIVLALVTTSLPFGTRMMMAAFLQIHRELEEAAATSGAGLSSTFFRILVPLLWPSFSRGFLWAFVRSLRETTIVLILYTVGNQTIAVTLWRLWMDQAELRLASAIAVPLMIVTTVLTFLVARQTMLGKEVG
jgi:iron(III) transport system permease protein